MAKKKKNGFDPEIEELRQNMPEDVRKNFDAESIKTVDDLFFSMIKKGIDPMKLIEGPDKDTNPEDFNPDDYAIEKDSDLDIMRQMLFGDDLVDEEAGEEWDDEPEDEASDDNEELDEDYLLGLTLPEQKFIGKPKQEYHIRIKLNNAPVSIWRELVVPSNITLEMLAYVLIDAMGWKHEHLYQYIGKNNVCFLNSRELKYRNDSFFSFMSRVQYKNSEKTTLEMVLRPKAAGKGGQSDANSHSAERELALPKVKGERLKFEYDFGDSWTHDLWVKGARDYSILVFHQNVPKNHKVS